MKTARSTVTILDDYQGVALTSADWSAVLANHDVDVVREHISDPDTLVDRLGHSAVVVAMRERTPFDAALLRRLPALRLLVTTGIANASIDVAAANELGIVVSGTGGVSTAVPELTLGMMIALTRNIAAEDRSMREGGWQHTIGPGISGRTLGIVGLGKQGVPVARLAQAFGMSVIAWSPNLTQQRADDALEGVRAVSKQQLFSTADVITVHMPLSERSRGLVGAADLAHMRATAYFVNTSRGPLVEEDALVEALRSRAIAGAALDVYDIEPLPVDHPLRSLPNTLLLPHLGYVSTDSYAVFYADAVADILAFEAGAPVRVLAP
ncbi:D-2-hydroxyacid dehydrogenase family protein [Subtercola endophyticus]|uniref:D-2-hydroxyacid dehydrogenase family protein n=1 Tax=Subtercola endophyticus TaxID=2895559 RepID=UPI001E39C4C2|nr:D-2-hydroxyacid dehydrogenase family protein [Subtercola endophyticus]UFS60537.1 D-2-hydroxyacid dehydrogenase family protein [Subtercola endophyticus]